ncbi:hypothetical protein RSAG8_10427, partial [Rhizoctonia solani AG-8 WAC10335]
MDQGHDSRLRYDSFLNGTHTQINDYDDHSMEYRELTDQPLRHASFPHPQSDDYFDGVDPYSSPTPLPRGSMGAGRRAMEFGMPEGSSTRVQDDDIFRYSYDPPQADTHGTTT